MFASMRLWALLLALFFVSSLVLQVASEDDDYEDLGDYGEDGENEGGEEAEGDVDEKDVVVLTDSNFEKTIEEAEFTLVEFYAPWCGHCQRLKPEYAKAATALKESNPNVVIAKVDATENNDLAEKYEVEGFPTMKWFVGKDASEYTGGRTADTIIQWVKKKAGKAATTISDAADVKKAEGEADVVAVAYFPKLEGEAYDDFIKTARSIDDIVFYETTSASVAEAAGIKGTSAPGIAIIKNFDVEDRSVELYDGKFTADALKAFASKHRTPLLPPFNEKYQSAIFESGIEKHVFVVADPATLKDAASMKPIREVALGLRGKVMFVLIDIEDEEASRVLEFFGLNDHKKGIKLVGFELETSKKYMFKAEIETAGLKKWAESVLDGTAEVDYKSEEPPEGDDAKDGNVVVVVGKTVDSIVMDPKKDVLLEVYAPWCGHCKALAPTYKKLAKRFADVDSVVIAKMDGTTNEHADISADGFPTIVFYPAEEGAKGISFDEGDRSLLALTKFIKKHAKIPYELPKKKMEDSDKGDDEAQVEL